MLVLLVAVVTGAWAAATDKLYLVVDGTSATLKYGTRGANDPYYSSDGFGNWANPGSVKTTATTITVDATCKNYQGTSLGSLFREFTALTVINNLENLNTANTTNISSMFDGCSSLTTLDLSSFNTAQVTQMHVMFSGCSSLTTLDLSSFNTASVTNMSTMFYGCSSLESIYVGDGWSTAHVNSSDGMFSRCTKLPNYKSGKTDKTNAHTGEGGYLKVKAKTYKVTLQEGTEDADKWTIPAEAEEGATVTATYSGTRKVKSVKAVKKAAASLIVNPVVGQIIGSDGINYDANATLPDGVTKVAMIAYVGNGSDCTNGLAIQLNSSPVEKDRSEAGTYATGLTAVPGGTWRLPSEADWQNMFLGCAKSGDASSASQNMNPISGFKEKIAATGITWKSNIYWSSLDYSSYARDVEVMLYGSNAYAAFAWDPKSNSHYVLGCLAF